MKLLVFALLNLLYNFLILDAARILGIFTLPARSHFRLGSKLMKELGKRGHEVTMIASFPQEELPERFTEVLVEEKDWFTSEVFSSKNESDYLEIPFYSTLSNVWNNFYSAIFATKGLESLFQHRKVQELLKEHFDLVIADSIIRESLIGFAYVYDCPFILFSPYVPNSPANHWVSNPAPYSYVPETLLPFSNEMSFWQRLINTYGGFGHQLVRNFYQLPMHNKLVQKFFKGAPEIRELYKKYLALVLVNSNPVINGAQPIVPSMIEIGGFHIDDPRALPKDVQDIMDGAENGVVLFSLGSIAKSSKFSPEKRNAVLKAFSKIKQKVIWKWEQDSFPEKPGNVYFFKWLPQTDILGHSNLKAFITHSGHLSITEAAYKGVPVIGIPIFGDQYMTISKVVQKGYGLQLNYNDLTEEKLTQTLNELLTNTSYRENARKISKILKDQPMKPLDKAMFWIEHVIRNNGAGHLKSAAESLHWMQLYLIDILLFTVLLFIIIIRSFRWLRRGKRPPVIKVEDIEDIHDDKIKTN